MLNKELIDLTNHFKLLNGSILPYDTLATFLELPFQSGNHQYLIISNVSYAPAVNYKTVVLSVMQIGDTVTIDKIVGASQFAFSVDGKTIKCKQTYANTNLRAYGSYLIIV